jgi:hypothetical protein
MTIAGELFEKTDDYLRGSAGLEQLDTWIANNAAELAELRDNDPMARLLGLIHVTLAEMDDAVAQEADLLSRLADFFSSYAERFGSETSSMNEGVEVFSSSSVEVGTLQTAEHIAA